ncbi:GntR family transcriptional regulator [Pseudomonas sp. FP1740]|uniref:GntR family transcriptional regulator n=1 Tax=Pseudomonas sp. FP1740 TaxID=2954078 RepID=UPI00273615D7|nr:GntR family transcriptional regulator [Pseudomonas sp. FP1740]WLG44227.1 GntR family transcriptional regulator [Pseudomonas sp. FP1740]
MASCALNSQHLTFPVSLRRRRAEEKTHLVDNIYPRVFDAILERRIDTDSRFTEASLGQMFGVNRNIIRHVLARLSQQQVILLLPNHRPQVAAPDAERTRQTLHARRLTESTLIRLACQQPQSTQLRHLRDLVARERESAERGLRGPTLRLSGEFHLLLAEFVGNVPLAWFLGSLVPPISLAIAQCEVPWNDHDAWQSHGAIVDAVERRDVSAAVRLMNTHLDKLEKQLFQT